MLKNYLIAAIRNLQKNKGFTIINILGLSIGLASFALISMYVYHEHSFDQYHEKANRIFRIVENLRTENELLLQSTSSPPMGPTLLKDFPEVQSYVRFNGGSVLVKKGDQSFLEEETYLADSTVFEIFTFPLLKGDPKTALTAPRSVVLTRDAAHRYFGDGDAIGQPLEIDGDPFTVTGVMENVRNNSHFTFSMLLSFSTWSVKEKDNEMHAWFWNGFHTYVLLKDEKQIESVRSKMKAFIERNIEKGAMHYEDLPLQPLTSIYLETPRSWENGKRGNLNNLYILTIIAIFIVVIACFNYVNLATARATRRLKEVGLRKVLGAQRRMLVVQFLGESIIVSILASSLGLLMAWLILPSFNNFIESELSISMFPDQALLWTCVGLFVIFLGIISGAYPALMISGFEPLQIFRPSFKNVFSHHYFRKVLVSIQFVISITLVAGTLLISDQLTLVRTQNLGFNKDATLLIQITGNGELRQHLDATKNEFLKINGVKSVSASHTVPGESTTNLFAMIEMENGKLSPTNINTNFIDPDFLPNYGIEIVAGRNFARDSKADDTTAFIINETAMRDFEWTPETAVGKKVDQNGKKGTIIGVAKDFHYRSLHHPIEPLMMNVNLYAYNKLSVKITTDQIESVIENVGKEWNILAPGTPYRYSFLEQDYNKLYKADAQLGKVASIFSSLAIVVGCLGLLGLTSFSVERRVKEIGIRKALGASVVNVIVMISKEFVGLILISFVIAIPVTYYLLSKWLENFTDRITIGPMSFILAGLSVLVVAWLTISYLSFKAAATNPGQALRNE